jgi:hypothetical protein
MRSSLSILSMSGMAVAMLCLAAHSGFAQSTARPVLVELFTSEGCSSCPPADKLLRDIAGKSTDSGETVVALSEHVTYWNYLGWADPFSAEIFTQRQAAYEDRFRLDSSYTPQIVVNGTRQFVGSNDAGVMRAVRTPMAATTVRVSISSAKLLGDHVDVAFTLAGDVPHDADLFAVLADDADSSHVQRGENSGETLQHVSVARSMERIVSAGASNAKTIRLSVPSGGTQPRHVVLFLQTKGLGPVLAIDTRPI